MENKRINIVYKKVDDLIPYENNPRNNDEAVDYVANSIKEFGFKVPCIVSSDGVLITGHTRLKACKKLGIEEVPCIVADDLTEDQIKAFRIADNKVSEYSTWDNEKLAEELSDIMMDMGQFGDDLFKDDDTMLNFLKRTILTVKRNMFHSTSQQVTSLTLWNLSMMKRLTS